MTMYHRNSTSGNRCCASNYKDKNLCSALFGSLTVIFLCASLAEPVWFHLECGKCCTTNFGIRTVFTDINKEFEENAVLNEENCDKEKQSDKHLVVEFVNTKAAVLIHVIIAFCVFAICLGIFSLLLDVFSLHKRLFLKLVQQYACGYIFTVILCANVVGICHQIAQDIYHFQLNKRSISISEANISIGVGVYLVIAAAGASVSAVALNLLRKHSLEDCFVVEDSDNELETTPLDMSEANEQPLFNS